MYICKRHDIIAAAISWLLVFHFAGRWLTRGDPTPGTGHADHHLSTYTSLYLAGWDIYQHQGAPDTSNPTIPIHFTRPSKRHRLPVKISEGTRPAGEISQPTTT
jgi:hypothetical protein